LGNARNKIKHLQKDTNKLIDACGELQKRVDVYKKKERKRQRYQEEDEDFIIDEQNEKSEVTTDSLSQSSDWSDVIASDMAISSSYEDNNDENEYYTKKDRKQRDGDKESEEKGEEEEGSDLSDSEDKIITIIESIPMDEQNQVIFPFSVGKGVNEVYIDNLGMAVPLKSGYDTARYVFPLGFTSRRQYLSCKNPSQKTTYTNRILMAEDQSDFPLFEVVADDDLQNPIRGHSCSGVWKTIKMRANEIRKTPIKNTSPSGPDYFGLSYPLVTFLIQCLPHVAKCKKYQFQDFKWEGPMPNIPEHAMQSVPPSLCLTENFHAQSPEENDVVSSI
jgi:hypothetical protein